MVENADNGGGSKSTSRDFPPRPEILVEIRRMVESIATRTTLEREAVEDLLTAVDEAAANAIRHGTPASGSDTIIRIICSYTPDSLEVRVRDFGTGFTVPDQLVMPIPEAMGGRGLPLMIALADAVSIQSTPEGTTVTLHKHHPSALAA